MNIISILYGVGGHDASLPNANIVETVSLEQIDGNWLVVTTALSGTTSRPATEEEKGAL